MTPVGPGRLGIARPASVQALWRDETAATSLEYALLLAAIAMSAVVSYQALGRVAGDSVRGAGGVLGALAGATSDGDTPTRMTSPTQ